MLLTCFVVVVVTFLGLRSLGRRFWEATLYGPFTGTPYVGSVTTAQLEQIAKQKYEDLNASSLEQARKMIAGTARSMGIEVID